MSMHLLSRPWSIGIVLAAVVSLAACTPHRSSHGAALPTPQPHGATTQSSPAARIAAHLALPAGQVLAMGANSTELRVAMSAAASEGHGTLVVVDAATGATPASWPIGSEPTAVATVGTTIWVSTGVWPGSNGVDETRVTEFGPTGKRLHSFAVTNPVALAADAQTVWAASYKGDDAFVTKLVPGADDRAVRLPGSSFGGQIAIALCGSLVYAVTSDATAGTTLVSTIGAGAAAATQVASLPDYGPPAISCSNKGVIVMVREAGPQSDSLRIYDVPAGQTPTTVSSRLGEFAATGNATFLLLDGQTPTETSAAVFDPNTLNLGPTLDIDGAVTAVAAGDSGGFPKDQQERTRPSNSAAANGQRRRPVTDWGTPTQG